MKPQHIIFVCIGCGSSHKTKQYVVKSGGERLLEQLQTLHRDWSVQDEFSIRSIDCMDACDQACAIALMSPGKPTCLFGNLPVEETQLESTAAAVLNYAGKYHAKPNGSVSYIQCPELLKKRMLAKIPPMPETANLEAPDKT